MILALLLAGLWIYHRRAGGAVSLGIFSQSSQVTDKSAISGASQELPPLERAVPIVPRIKFSKNQKQPATSPALEVPAPPKP